MKLSYRVKLEQADGVDMIPRRATAGELALVTSTLVLAEIGWTLATKPTYVG